MASSLLGGGREGLAKFFTALLFVGIFGRLLFAPALSDAELAEKERKREALSAKRSWDMKMRWREKKAAENPDE